MFKTKAEKNAYKAGIKKGRNGGEVWKSKNHAKKKRKKINPLERYTVKNKRSGKYIFPQNRNRYIVTTHFDDAIDDSKYLYTQFASSKGEALAKAKEREAFDRKIAEHSLVNIYSDIIGPEQKKYKIKRRYFQ